jgi:hypothetical protein
MTYGDSFADFIADFEPASELAYLADVTRLEAARTRAYHAADAAPVDPNALQSIDESMLRGMRIVRHPAAEVIRSAFPIVSIWSMNTGDREPEAIEDWSGEDALVVRPAFEVFVQRLPAGGAAFLTSLFAGAQLVEAIDAAQADHPDFDLVASLAVLISSGAAARISIPD